jgi:ribulose-5-phosphate 4-epimerase/fuculose-1-phosphate aldolase
MDRSAEAMKRRAFLLTLAGAASAISHAAHVGAQPAPTTAGTPDPRLLEDLVAANRILADQGVVDGFGHVSVRHDRDPNRYLLSRSVAPELVTAADIMEFDLESAAVDAHGRSLYLERFIHGEIYKARPDVKAVVHNHSPSVIPFGATGVRLRPLYHMSAFLWRGVPVFEIRAAAGGPSDMLVRNAPLGRALAQTLGDKAAALMRGHGAVVVGDSLPSAVRRSVYLEMNARLQGQAINLAGDKVIYLDDAEAKLTEANDAATTPRVWELWRRKALGGPR